MSESNQNNTLLIPLFAGLAGALLALLVAPRSGKDTRRQLQLATGEMKDKAAKSLDTARANMEEGASKLKGVKNRLSSAIHFTDKKSQTNNETNQDSTAIQRLRTWDEEL